MHKLASCYDVGISTGTLRRRFVAFLAAIDDRGRKQKQACSEIHKMPKRSEIAGVVGPQR